MSNDYGEFHRVYYMQNESRHTIIVDMICPNCAGIIVTDGDFYDHEETVRFSPVPQCPHCFNVFSGAGIVPTPRTARRWIALYFACEWEYEHKDIVSCFYEDVNKDVKRSGGNGGKKRSTPPQKFERHCNYGE